MNNYAGYFEKHTYKVKYVHNAEWNRG